MTIFSDHVFSLTRVRFFKIDPTSVKQDQNVFFKVQQKER